ncbi:hypothetical protein [Halorientalis halophila]|uniref:hypothetical protein n=1 Tax=Halorientalis halophila TaxID=3108499 RepID=UPI00300986C0
MEIECSELDQWFAVLVCAEGVEVLDVAELIQVPVEGEVLQSDVDLIDIHVLLIVLVEDRVDLLCWLLATADKHLNPYT